MNPCRFVAATSAAAGTHTGGGPKTASSQAANTAACSCWCSSKGCSGRRTSRVSCCHACGRGCGGAGEGGARPNQGGQGAPRRPHGAPRARVACMREQAVFDRAAPAEPAHFPPARPPAAPPPAPAPPRACRATRAPAAAHPHAARRLPPSLRRRGREGGGDGAAAGALGQRPVGFLQGLRHTSHPPSTSGALLRRIRQNARDGPSADSPTGSGSVWRTAMCVRAPVLGASTKEAGRSRAVLPLDQRDTRSFAHNFNWCREPSFPRPNNA
jgi:hypothetical protein